MSSSLSALPSPPATRLRTRKASGEAEAGPSSSVTSKGKSKAKHVGFSESVEVNRLPSPLSEAEESDLTDLTEVENSLQRAGPSPRRLRSKGSVSKLSASQERRRPDDIPEANRRVTPARKAKGKIGSLHESTDEEAEEDQLDSDGREDEVDELQDSPTPMATPKGKTAPYGRRTPVKNRLRARHLQTHTPPSDGDDEDSEEEGTVVAGEDGDDEVSEDGEDEETVHEEPRKLRNGKIVGDGEAEEEIGEEDEDEDEDEDEEGSADSESIASSVDEGDVDAEGESDEAMEDDDGASLCLFPTLSLAEPQLQSTSLSPQRRRSCVYAGTTWSGCARRVTSTPAVPNLSSPRHSCSGVTSTAAKLRRPPLLRQAPLVHLPLPVLLGGGGHVQSLGRPVAPHLQFSFVLIMFTWTSQGRRLSLAERRRGMARATLSSTWRA